MPKSKEVIQLMCEVANKYNEFEEDLFQSCIRREELAVRHMDS
ncbi:MAG: hypothetical protein ACLRQF_00995 [Thomasclavelia ramosa]